MMKKGLVVISVICMLMGCSSFLDETPDNRVALDNLDKTAQLLTNAYSIASPAFTDWMTDDVDWTLGTTKRPHHEQIFIWQDVSNASPEEQDTPDFFWYETYNAIAHANEALNVLDELPVANSTEEAKKEAVRSEALLTRAYGHFMLVNLFAPSVAQSPSVDGIPYVKTPETTFIKPYKRKLVRRVYDDIEDDLLEGIDLLDESFFSNSGKYHFNRNAALAFAVRFYLYKRDFVKCREYANEMLGDSPELFVRDLTGDDFQNASSSITLYPQLYSSPDEQANLLLMRKVSLVQRTDFAFGPSTEFYRQLYASNLFAETIDQREDPALRKGQQGVFPVRFESLFERASLNSNVGTPYHIGIAFRGEEVLINRAEANIYLNELDKVIDDLNVLSKKRYSGGDITLTLEAIRTFYNVTDDASISDQDILLNYLLLEKRKEFISQGMRWFDIKRYGIEVVHDLPLLGSFRLESNDPRKILQIPKSAQDVSDLEPNPR